MNEHEKWMKAALLQAETAFKCNEVPVGAVLILDNEVIAESHNKTEISGNPLHHAEMLVLEELISKTKTRWTKGLSLYVTLEPCIMCYGAIVLHRIDTLVYGAADKKAGFSRFLKERTHLNHVPYVISGIAENECSRLLSDFFEYKRRGSREV